MSDNRYYGHLEDTLARSIRKRPAMYIGGTDFFGFIHYVVSAFDLMMDNHATWIEFEAGNNLTLTSDAAISTSLSDQGLMEPFEVFQLINTRHLPDAAIVNALSHQFRATTSDGITETIFESARGERQLVEQRPTTNTTTSSKLEFSPDEQIFKVTSVSPSVVHGYCRRMSCLHPGITFRIKSGDQVTEYKTDDGLLELFNSFTTPYQILHKPVRLCETEGDLTVAAMFAFHSWAEDKICSFANRGRVPDGGTHEDGLLKAIYQFRDSNRPFRPTGVLAVLTFEYPHVTYEGCVKNRIGNPELTEAVAELVKRGTAKWLEANPDEAELLRQIEPFTFGESW